MTQYNNTLDNWYANCHWAIQEVLRAPYEQVSEWLRFVTGDPNKVGGEAQTYVAMASEVSNVAGEVQRVAASIHGWEGEAREAFNAKMAELQQAFQELAPAIEQTQEILHAAAETAVEAANMILDIIKMAIEFLVTSLAIAAALAVFTAGASFVAWIAGKLAYGAAKVAEIMNGLARVAQVLNKIAELLNKVREVFLKIKHVLKFIAELLKALKAVRKEVGLLGKGILFGVEQLIRLPIKAGGNLLLDGVEAGTGMDFDMPSGVGTGRSAVEHGGNAVGASNRAVDAATGAP